MAAGGLSLREEARLETHHQEMETNSVHLLLVGASCRVEEVNKRVRAAGGRASGPYFMLRTGREWARDRKHVCACACLCVCVRFQCFVCGLSAQTVLSFGLRGSCVCVCVCVIPQRASASSSLCMD